MFTLCVVFAPPYLVHANVRSARVQLGNTGIQCWELTGQCTSWFISATTTSLFAVRSDAPVIGLERELEEASMAHSAVQSSSSVSSSSRLLSRVLSSGPAGDGPDGLKSWHAVALAPILGLLATFLSPVPSSISIAMNSAWG